MSKLAYRRDIDGLRAIAVGGVVITHANLSSAIAGGYVGVDVFFVISGYLISTILLREVADERFSIGDFYRRRVLRILPALLTVVAAGTVGAFLWLFSSELVDYAKSGLSALFFASNIYFRSTVAYFGPAQMATPLLHTWSLAVEEQFYIVFPLFLWTVHRYQRRRLAWWVVGLGALSFALCVFQMRSHDSASAFYFATSRAWELLLGTALALDMVEMPYGDNATVRNLTAGAGLLLIVAPMILYSAGTHVPGMALPPCLGAALVIAAGKHGTSLVTRLLSTRPMVFIGLISYSLYLWHWPLLSFQSLGMPFPILPYQKAMHALLMLAAVVLATLSWHFVEKPFRGGRLARIPTPRVLAGAAAAVLVLAAVLGAIVWNDGFPGRFPSDVMRYASFLKYDESYMRTEVCLLDSARGSFRQFDDARCLLHDTKRPNVLILGDSKAADLYLALSSTYPGVAWSQANATGCAVPDPSSGEDSPLCRRLLAHVLNDYLPKQHVDRIFLGGIWSEIDLPAVRKALIELKARGVPIVLFGPGPRYAVPLPRLLARGAQQGDATLAGRFALPGMERLDADMKRLSEGLGVRYISVYGVLCAGGCRTTVGAVPLMFDGVHLTREGADLVARRPEVRAAVPQ